MTSTPHRVAVVGASGHTGSFVVDELARHGFVPVAIGRDPARLVERGFARRGIAVATASLDDVDALDAAIDGVAAVVNCAGPFLDTAEPVVAAALRAGVHYLDVTAEQASAAATLGRTDAAARRAGVVVLPAMGFFGGLADLMCTATMEGWERASEVRVGIALDTWSPTPGTRATGRRNTVPRVVIEGGRQVPMPDPVPATTITFPEPFGRQPVTAVALTEVPLIARHLPVDRLRTWLTDTALDDLRDPATPPPTPADESGRSAQRFLVDVVVHGSDGSRRATATGRDIYAVTAPLVVEAVRRCLEPATRRRGGAVAPGEIFDAADFLRSLTPTHVQFSMEPRRQLGDDT